VLSLYPFCINEIYISQDYEEFQHDFFFRIFERLCLLEQNSFDNQPFTCVLMEAIIIFFVAG
jgi:hypothetical protein